MSAQTGAPARRRRRSRAETESELLDAALRLLDRDGVLAGVNLREVAKEAGVNHGQIYQYFGSRQSLLRAAIARQMKDNQPDPARHWKLPFAARRRAMWRWSLRQRHTLKLEALLALDGDPRLVIFPALDRTRESLARDTRDGALTSEVDPEVAHAMTAAAYLGYAIFRETFARELGLPPDELDRRAAVVYDRMVAGLRGSED
ncbi:MAG TPA: TetR/AcrR family transcriptional regulator [Streptosporangiaceae bacterium]